MFFEIAFISLFVVLLWQTNKWFGLFFILAIVSAIYPNGGPISWLALRTVFFAVLWYFFVVQFVNTTGVQSLMDAMCIIALCNVALLITQVMDLRAATIGINLIYMLPADGSGMTPVGLMANRNEASCLLSFCAPAFFSRRKWKYFFPAIILGLVLAQSVGGILATSVGVLFYLCIKGKIIWSLFFTISGISLYCLFVDTPGFERWEVWKKGWQLYKEHWIFGSGLGHWKILFAKLKVGGVWWVTAHNEPFQALFEMGIGFAIIATGYALNVVRRFRKDALLPTTALVIIFTNSLVHFGFHIATTMMIAVTWLGILEVSLREAKNRNIDILHCGAVHRPSCAIGN